MNESKQLYVFIRQLLYYIKPSVSGVFSLDSSLVHSFSNQKNNMCDEASSYFAIAAVLTIIIIIIISCLKSFRSLDKREFSPFIYYSQPYCNV